MSQLTREQRYTISAMYKQGRKQKDIAAVIGKDKSVVSRELKRNRSAKGTYSFGCAQALAEARKYRLRRCRKFTGEVKNRIERYMRKEQMSPEQIVGFCKEKGYNMVSIERIYQYIRKDKADGGDLYKNCRHALKHRKRPVGQRFPIKDRVSIDERPVSANGKRFGDWEMDLIVGANNKGAMVTLVERSTGHALIRKLPKGKDAKGVYKAVVAMLLPFKKHVLTITTDNGPEFAEHKRIAKALDTKVYFAHPYCSWEKGLIEYTNKLYRQYIPKGANFNDFSEQDVQQIQYKINRRPRKKLAFKTPKKCFYDAIHA
jgi:transposase, IS30 family